MSKIKPNHKIMPFKDQVNFFADCCPKKMYKKRLTISTEVPGTILV